MFDLLDFPVILSLISLLVLWLSAWIGLKLSAQNEIREDARADFGIILGATLTLLGLIIGFTFSMAIGRYDQRKNLEEEEANAIGTEYVRADLLPTADAARVRALLKEYLHERVAFYELNSFHVTQVGQVDQTTAELQTRLWEAVAEPAKMSQTPMMYLTVSGMNDVLNSQGYTQAAWWNRIPLTAWVLMAAIAIFSNLLIGFGAHRPGKKLLVVLPLLVSLSFLLIADIDSPRGGLIHMRPLNLITLAGSLRR